MYLYKHMLDPDLYDDPFVSNFISNLLEPEIVEAGNTNFLNMKHELLSPDDIQVIADDVVEDLKDRIMSHDIVPKFIAYTDKTHKINLSSDNSPTQDLFRAAKCVGFCRSAQCVFFSSHALGKAIVIGSSLRGHCFVNNFLVEGNSFTEVQKFITKDGSYNYPFSRFYHISDNQEMEAIIKEIPKLIVHSGVEECESLKNFATTLIALHYLRYLR